jgi:MFS family permease
MGNVEATAEGAVGALVLIFVARIGAGIAGATIGTAQAAIADSTTQQGRSRGMALIGAAFGLGFFLGPILGAGAVLVFEGSLGAPGYLAAGLSAVALGLGLRYLPETRRAGSPHGRRHWLNLEGWRLARDTPAVPGLILIFFLSTFAFGNFEATLTVLTQVTGLALKDAANFLVFSYIGFVLALAQGVLYRRLAKRVPELTFMFSGCILMMLGLGGIGTVAYLASEAHSRNPGLLVALLLVLVVAITGFAFMVPSVQALVSRLSDPERQGEILGINQSMNAIARILGPAIGLPLFRPGHHILPYIFGTLLLVISLVLTWRVSTSDALAHLRKEGPHAA